MAGMQQLIETLRSTEIFSGLSDSMLETIAANCTRVKRGKGVQFVFQGEPGHTMFVVLKGRVSVTTINEHGDEVFVAERGAGDTIGEMSLLDGSRRSAHVTTSTECELLILERDTFVRCLRESPELALKIMASLVGRIRELTDTVSKKSPVRARLAEQLDRLADQFGVESRAGTRIESGMTKTDLATRVGAAREVVSRALSNLKSDGIVDFDGRIVVVLDRRRLKVEAKK